VAWPPILVRYGEIGIKTRSVRASFERRLVERIEEQLVARGVEAEVARERGRVFVRAHDVEGALDALTHTFGIVSASPAIECEATPEGVAAAAVEVARERLRPGMTFAMKVKRVGEHPFTSLDVAKKAAGRIFDEFPDRQPKVNLTSPDLAIHAEVREGEAFVFILTVKGPGGLPLGSQGRVGVLVDSPRAAHAAWLMGKRGAALFLFAPDLAQAEAWMEPLAPWVPGWKVRPVEGRTRPELLAALKPALRAHKCQALVVADGTQDAIAAREEDAIVGVPVFRPLVGYAGRHFAALSRIAELPAEV
jgi:thiamine biosynthesis protein ThiI